MEVCGDGILVSVDQNICDDGNLMDGDGCSSACSVENYYRCNNSNTNPASVCTYLGIELVLSVKYIERTGD